MAKEPKVVYVAHGCEVVTHCGCGNRIHLTRSHEGTKTQATCQECGFNTIYIWPPVQR